MLFNLFLIAFLLFLNGFFVASEFAIVSARKTRISQLVNEGNKDAKVALESIEHMDRSIAATQLGITIASIGLGWVGEATIAKLIMKFFEFLPEALAQFATHSVAITISFALITIFHVIIGELMPKSIALQFTERTVLTVARPLKFVTVLFTPFIWLLNGCGNFILSLFKIPPAHAGHLVCSVEEIDMIIDESHKEGVLNDTEKEILQNVFKFSDTLAKQVMVPRTDITGIDIETTEDELNKIIMENQYTRYPVYEEDMDHIIGVLHVKDIYPLIVQGKEIKLRNILRSAILVPETVTMDNLLLEFKEKKSQIALVIDEFGGTSGLITLEDVLEEIFGEVQDEFDDEEAEIRQIYENEYIANAMLRLDEFNEFFEESDIKVNLEDDDVETLGGLVVKHLGHIANVSDEAEFNGFLFKVLEIDGARVVKLKIKRLEQPQDAENSEEN